MKHRFLVDELNHTILLVDITQMGLLTAVDPSEGKPQEPSSLRSLWS